jgi:hypothetical protein
MVRKIINWIIFTLIIIFLSFSSEYILKVIFIEEMNQNPFYNILYTSIVISFWINIILSLIFWINYTIKGLYSIALYIEKMKVHKGNQDLNGLLKIIILIPISKSIVDFLKKMSEFSDTPIGKGLAYMFGMMGFFLGIISFVLALISLN